MDTIQFLQSINSMAIFIPRNLIYHFPVPSRKKGKHSNMFLFFTRWNNDLDLLKQLYIEDIYYFLRCVGRNITGNRK